MARFLGPAPSSGVSPPVGDRSGAFVTGGQLGLELDLARSVRHVTLGAPPSGTLYLDFAVADVYRFNQSVTRTVEIQNLALGDTREVMMLWQGGIVTWSMGSLGAARWSISETQFGTYAQTAVGLVGYASLGLYSFLFTNILGNVSAQVNRVG